MKFAPFCRRLPLALLWLVSLHGATDEALVRVWRDVADSKLPEAELQLSAAPKGDARKVRLTEVVIGMGRPPISRQDFDQYQRVLAELAAGRDELANLALYLEARLFQVHAVTPDYAQAEALYLALAVRSAGSHWAQLGLVKVGLIRLYALATPTVPADRLASVEALLGRIAEPALKRDLQLQIGWAGLHYGRPLDEILPHLIAAEAAGGLMGITPENLVLQIGELSFRSGKVSQARAYFGRFLAEYPTSIRRYNVEQRLLGMGSQPGRKGRGQQ
jgi:hypothetical protein